LTLAIRNSYTFTNTMINGLTIIVASYIGFIIAYKTYGQWLGKRVFRFIGSKKTPAHRLSDSNDFVPSHRWMVFGHHFTSIAGTGPIVGPAIGVIWGWVPAVIWVVLGSIFMGAVHDLGALAISLKRNGKSICEVTHQIISKRAQRVLFFVVSLALWIVIAIFGLIIAIIFNLFPQSVGPVWAEIPIAVAFGVLSRKFPHRFISISIIGIFVMCSVIVLGYLYPIQMPDLFGIPATGLWTMVLLTAACIASALPIQTLLQPRDYLNAWQLWIILGTLTLGAIISGINGKLTMVAPAVVSSPTGAPPMLPFICITIACGAISGFHSLVASGTSSKQLTSELDAIPIGYGSMIIEGALAVMIIVACCAGIGLGYPHPDRGLITGVEAWNTHYLSWGASAGLASKLSAVVVGCANIMTSLGIPQSMGMVIMGVFIASFAGTTLDTSTRLQRYLLQELFSKINRKPSAMSLSILATVSGAGLAFSTGVSGKGALELWPLFGVLNQLLACLGLGIITLTLWKRPPIIRAIPGIPFMIMLLATLAASIQNQWNFLSAKQWLLFGINGLVLYLCGIIIFEGAITCLKSNTMSQHAWHRKITCVRLGIRRAKATTPPHALNNQD
jgi:carbon starvation protein